MLWLPSTGDKELRLRQHRPDDSHQLIRQSNDSLVAKGNGNFQNNHRTKGPPMPCVISTSCFVSCEVKNKTSLDAKRSRRKRARASRTRQIKTRHPLSDDGLTLQTSVTLLHRQSNPIINNNHDSACSRNNRDCRIPTQQRNGAANIRSGRRNNMARSQSTMGTHTKTRHSN
jgi:hypothetical protein